MSTKLELKRDLVVGNRTTDSASRITNSRLNITCQPVAINSAGLTVYLQQGFRHVCFFLLGFSLRPRDLAPD